MAIVPTFQGDVVKGALKMSDRERKRMSDYIKTLKNGTHLNVTIKKHKKERTNPQNAYYWSVIIPILGDHFGYDKIDMHEALKAKFNSKPNPIDDNLWIAESTTKLSTVEFNEYLDVIKRWASMDHGVYLPEPNEVESN